MKKILMLTMIVGLCFSTILMNLPRAKASLDPVAYWKFDEGSGSIAYDSSGNGNNGTLINNPQWVDGVRGKALKFNGVNNSVYVADSPSLDITGTQMSVEYWIELPGGWQAGMTKPMDIYVKGDAWVGSMTNATGTHRFNFAYFPNPYPETNKNSWNANTWYFIADVYDGSYIKMYVNGALDVAAVCSGAITVTNEHFEIGGGYGWPWFFNGTIDELEIYNYARTAAQIAADYQLRNIALSPYAGFASTTITGSGFSSNSKVTITWDGTTIPSVPSSVITDTTGSFAALISVPTQTAPGAHTINATDESGNLATATFTVVDMTGSQGPKGDTGTQGSTGLQGQQGLKGDIGDTGPQGPAGTLGETQLVLIAFPTAASIFALCIAVVALLRKRS